MKKITKIAAAVVVASGMVAPAYADLMAMSTAHVYMDVAPHVSVGSGSSSTTTVSTDSTCDGYAGYTDGICWDQNIDLGSFQVGPVPASINFFVEANIQEIELACGATDLYKGSIAIDPTPTDPHDDPILLNTAKGCKITMSGATPASGGTNVGLFTETDVLVGDQSTWTVHKTGSIPFHANVSEPSRNVNLMLEWDHNNPEQRIGQYSGFVKMYVLIPGI